MLIQQLILTDYRVYSGRHEFDLSPRKRYGKVRPIVLFGGLNGAGKTSILSGVRLALYGRASFGQRISQRQYEEHLADSLHRAKQATKSPRTASVELTFSYAKLGVESHFHIVRSWEVKNEKVKEHLRILENGEPIKGLDQEQAQSFLNELIPIGLSDLFFFDGEKISQLADNTGGSVLEHSIKNLLGLDIVERLSGDLTVLNRQLVKASSRSDIDKAIDAQQSDLAEIRNKIEVVQREITVKSSLIAEKRLNASQIRKLLNDRGAHFSTSRKDLENELDRLNAERETLSLQATILLGDATPFTLASEFCGRVMSQVEQDLESATAMHEAKSVDKALSQLLGKLKKKLPPNALQTVVSEVSSLTSSRKVEHAPVHDLTPSQAGSLFATLEKSQQQSKDLLQLFDQIEAIEKRIDEIIAALARAPDDAIVREDFENLQITQQEIGRLEAELSTLRENAKSLALNALEIAKKLDKLFLEASKTSDQRRVLDYIGSANQLLGDFVALTAAKKIRELEEQFTRCFSRLARKDDLALMIRIDPKTYNVALLAEDGRRIGKEEISAGEKQIFAISMLEALAKTSGRQLPMIVDTPLGRLDSKHRQKLIEGYFPQATHQMIILSTDTEVDENFYRSLSPEISRAYKLEYNSKLGSTHVEEGYFWQMRQAG
jgi:DNA sulfur modification protein DndD